MGQRWAIVWLLTSLLITSGASGAFAQSAGSVIWERFDVDLTLLPDATYQVVETQEIYFDGTFQKGFREIPFDRVMGITEVGVAEGGVPYGRGSGQPGTFSVGRNGDVLRVDWWFTPANNQRRTFTIVYRVAGALRVYDAGDQIYWKAIYADRPGPVRAGNVTIRLPGDVAASDVRLAGYPGHLVQDARLVDRRTAQVTTRELPAGTGMDVRLQIPHGLVSATPPAWQSNADFADWYNDKARPIIDLASLALGLAIPLLGGLWLLVVWYLRGRDPQVGRLPEELFEPPGDLPPGLVGTIVDERADVQDVVATLVDFGNRGILSIRPVPGPGAADAPNDYQIVRSAEQPVGLRPYERTVLGVVLPTGGEVSLSVLKGRFAPQIPLFQEQMYAEAVRSGLFVADPEKVRRRFRLTGGLLLTLGFFGTILGFTLLAGVAELLFMPFLGLAVLGVFFLVAAGRMPQRTRQGALEAARWSAFKKGLEERSRTTNASDADEPFERFLPYAVALGVDRAWMARFARAGAPAPSWFGMDSPVLIGAPSGPSEYSGSSGGPWAGPQRGETSVPGGSSPSAGEGPERHEPGGVLHHEGGLQSASDFLADLLNSASDALASGGGSDWSGGGDGGGGDSGGGGSGGGSGGFE